MVPRVRRGQLQRILPFAARRIFQAPRKANLAQTVLFVLVHHHLVYPGMPIRLLPVFALGLTLGYTFLRSEEPRRIYSRPLDANGVAALILLLKAVRAHLHEPPH